MRSYKENYRHFLLIGLLLALGACGAYVLDTAQVNLRNTFASGNFAQSASLLDQLSNKKVYSDKEQVLYHLERGTVLHFNGDYKDSFASFKSAEDEIDRLFTRSIARGLGSLLTNDNALAYSGEDYEDVYTNAFNTLNFIHLNDLDGALVEARRMSYKLENINIRYNGLVETLSRQDTTKRGGYKPGKSNVQNSAMGHYLSTILYAKTNKPDNARIDYERLWRAFDDQSRLFKFQAPQRSKLDHLQDPDSYNVLIMSFAGRSPEKHQNDIRIRDDELKTYLKFSLPTIHVTPSVVQRIKVITAYGESDLYMVENMQEVAKEVFRVREPIIYTRALLRSIAKTVAVKALEKQADKKENNSLATAIRILGAMSIEASEKADLRGWQTMPGIAYATTLKLPEGKHDITIQYINTVGQIVSIEKKTVNISASTELSLIETLYWN